MRLYGNLQNRLLEGAKNPEPHVGMDATVVSYSDRRAGEIVQVNKNKKGEVREVMFRRFDARLEKGEPMGSQKWILTPNPKRVPELFTKRRNGQFVNAAASLKHGNKLVLGLRDHYYDWEF